MSDCDTSFCVQETLPASKNIRAIKSKQTQLRQQGLPTVKAGKAAAQAVEAGLAAAKPGMSAASLNTAIQQALVKTGYEQYSSEARGHGTGHGTGMDPEEEQPWIGPGNETILRENMVFTLKATVTVPGIGGLRTERIVRLTADGCEPLDVFPMELYW